MDEQEFDGEDVREQIEQQRVLAAQLRDKLEHDEQQLASKEQQNELLKSKLSLIKSRSKSKRGAGLSEKDDKNSKISKDNYDGNPRNLDSDNVGRKQSHISAKKGKINILREQLEQNRLRFERHGIELSEDTRSMEAVVEQLKHELEERDVTIQQLQAGQVSSDAAVTEEAILNPVDVETQLLLKEDEVKKLIAQVTNQQHIILELQENLKEKDCVIEARTQAISLLSEDMSKKWRANVDMLEETRQQMQMMQENFVRIEAGLNTEIDQLNKQLQHNAKKLSQAEQNVKVAEVARNDLAMQHAELLEELKSLRSKPQAGTELEDARHKIEELNQAITEANKLTVKLKAEQKLKVKSLNKQIDSLRKESDFSGELAQLQNQIAQLDKEKVTQDQKFDDLQKTLTDLQNEKITAENKISEIEGQLLSRDAQIYELNLKLEEKNCEIKILQQSLSEVDHSANGESVTELQQKLEEARSALKESQSRYEEMERLQKSLSKQVLTEAESIDFASDIQELRAKVAHYEDNLTLKVDFLERTINEKQNLVQELETTVRESFEKIEHLTSLQNLERKCAKCETMNNQLAEKEIFMQKQEALLNELKSLISNLKEENESLRASSNNILRENENIEGQAREQFIPKQLQDPTNTETDLQRELIEASGELELKREECARLESKLKAQVEKTKKIAVHLKAKTVAHKELEDRVSKFESVIQNSKIEIDQLSREKQDMLEKWQTEMSEKDAILSQIAEKLASRELDVQHLSEELQSKSLSVVGLESELSSLQAHVKELQLAIDEKCAVISEFQDSAEQSHHIEGAKVAELQAHVVSCQNELASVNNEKQEVVTKLENFTKQAKIKLAKEKKLRTDLLEKQSELEALLLEKNNALIDVQLNHDKEKEYLQQEKGRLEALLQEHQDQINLLHQELEHEKNKIQYASENVMTVEEQTEVAEELQPQPSIETFQGEVEDLCLSVVCDSPQDLIPILEEEKNKTMNELSSSFESLHNQIMTRIHGRPDLHVDRKLFTELKNLVTRVMNRTAALENKIKKVVSDSQSRIQEKLLDADKSIQTLENSMLEARQHLDVIGSEKSNLENAVTDLNKERCDLMQQIEQKDQKSSFLESKLKDAEDKVDNLIQSTNTMQQEITDKQIVIQDLDTRCQGLFAHNEQIQQELHNIHQTNFELQSTLDQQIKLHLSFQEAHQDCENFKSNLCLTHEELQKSNQKIVVLESHLDDARKRCEDLQHQADESIRQTSEMQLQIQNALQLNEELQQQLTTATAHLQQEQETYLQQSAVWSGEKQQYEVKLSELLRQLEVAPHEDDKGGTTSQSETYKAEEVELLRQQLSDKTAEIENYQRRLIQLQMQTSNSSVSDLGLSSNRSEQTFDTLEKPVQTYASDSSSFPIFNAFDSVTSPFESSEINDLHMKIKSMTEHIDLISSERRSLENEKTSIQRNLDLVNDQLIAVQNELEAASSVHSRVGDLEHKVSELTSELHLSQACVEREKFNANKLEDDIKALQWKLENEKFAKEKALEGQKKSEDRPSIPQTLDTHVSSLQDSGSAFNGDKKSDSFVADSVDESLMEKNITELESELRGMVSSQHESALKQKAMDNTWNDNENTKIIESDVEKGESNSQSEIGTAVENTNFLKNEVHALQKKMSQLEEEKSKALAQIDALQAEIKTLSESLPETTRKSTISVSDALMSEDESWGWGADSAQELKHQELKNQNQPLSDNVINDLQMKVNSLSIENNLLEKDKVQITEDLKASQIRSAKLAKKLRELKAKYDELLGKNRSSDSPFDSLDQTIEEERMKQMQSLERELKETQTELVTVKTERDKLQKQVDVLSSANECMLEAKERQDLEVEMWQKRSKDLTNQVQALEWKIGELEEKDEKPIPKKGASDTQICEKSSQSLETLNPVEIDQLLKENHTWNTNYENLMQEYQKLRAQCLADSEQRAQVDALILQQKGMIERLEHEKTYFQDVYDSLKMDYEAACAQLASKQTDVKENLLKSDQVLKLEDKLVNVEKQLEETIMQLQIVSSDNVEFQAQCSQLNDTRRQLMQQLDESHVKLEANAQEISRLQENVRNAEGRFSVQVEHIGTSESVDTSLINDAFVLQGSKIQNSSPGSSLLNWGEVVSGKEHPSVGIFDTIASNTAQSLEDQLQLKENELQKDRRMIETLKRTHEEAEQEWGQIIEYHKSQLETAKKAINDLQCELQTLKVNTTSANEGLYLKHDVNDPTEENQQLRSVIFAKEKEIESLQISLAVSEESKLKLEQEWQIKEAEVNSLMSQIPQTSDKTFLPQVANTTTSEPTEVGLTDFQSSDFARISNENNLSHELDQALYMLHERDIRCEELTLELTRLLEERDTLQLRLSNVIRTNEEMRERLKLLLPSQSINVSSSTLSICEDPGSPASINLVESSSINAASTDEASANSEEGLEKKLAELRKIGYSHDKWLRDDREYRHHQQMRLMSPVSPVLSGSGNELETTVDILSEPLIGTTQSSSSVEASNADQSMSNDSQGSILGWFWGRN